MSVSQMTKSRAQEEGESEHRRKRSMPQGRGNSVSPRQARMCCKDVTHALHREVHLVQQSCEGLTMRWTEYRTLQNLMRRKHNRVFARQA